MITHRTLRPGARATLCGLSPARLHRTDQDSEVTCRRCQLLIAAQPAPPSASDLARELARISRSATHEVTCSECGKVFPAARPNALTCGPTCRSKRRNRLNPRPSAQAVA